MSFARSYFDPGDLHPMRLVERLLNPYRSIAETSLQGHPLRIEATRRALGALDRRSKPLSVELQLYFSCVVKKRVLFHEEAVPGEESVSDRLSVRFRPVEALTCDPVEFAANYPERRELKSKAASKMHPSRLLLDYRKGRWQGDFDI
ncbi:MAG: hypothetical protein R6X15_02280 [Pseudomonadota bacterium]